MMPCKPEIEEALHGCSETLIFTILVPIKFLLTFGDSAAIFLV